MNALHYIVCRECGTRWETRAPQNPRHCNNPECEASWLDLPMFVNKDDADRAAERFAQKAYTFTFTAEQHTTLIAALALAAQQYAHPEVVVDTLAVINESAALSLRESLAKRDEVAAMREP